MLNLSIAYEADDDFARAQQIAKRLNLPINNQSDQKLIVTKDKIVLKIKSFSPLYVDFASTTWQNRRNAGKQQGLVRACKPKQGMRIIDATAGWGRDAAILASFGAQVLMLERQPIMAALLEDALKRQDRHSQKVLQLKLYPTDALTFLKNLAPKDYPEVIYLDPMHPQRQKTALVKKDMQVLQTLIVPDEDPLALLELALAKNSQKVVVKWPQHLAPLLPPSISIPGKVVRFDVYNRSTGSD